MEQDTPPMHLPYLWKAQVKLLLLVKFHPPLVDTWFGLSSLPTERRQHHNEILQS
jgi:hypothetical protein